MLKDIMVFNADDYLKQKNIEDMKGVDGAEEFFRLPVITPDTVPGTGLGMAMFVLPPGQKTNPHIHSDTTHVAIYVVQGSGTSYIGDNDEHVHDVKAGDFIYVPPDVRHYTVNTGTETILAVVARTAPERQDTEL